MVAMSALVVAKNLIGLPIVELAAFLLLASSDHGNLISMLLRSLLTGFRNQAAMQAEIIALRHQLIVLQRSSKTKRLILGPADRCVWVWLSRLWSRWRSALIIVKPETVIGWHRQGFQWYWTWKSRHDRSGRPLVSKETRDLIHTMSRDNSLYVDLSFMLRKQTEL
jgi:hypothetical protein